MSVAPTSSPNQPTQTPEMGYPAVFAWLAAVVFGAGAGAAAAMLQRWFAPIGVFPIVIGTIVGLAIGGVWAGRGGGSKRSILLSAALGGLICLATLHWGSYLLSERAAAVERQKAREALLKLTPEPGQLFEPFDDRSSFPKYVGIQLHVGRALGPRRIGGPLLVAWWIGDALLVLTGAVLAAAGVGKPYASRKTATTTNFATPAADATSKGSAS